MPDQNLELLDRFAEVALSALISKMPFLDVKGEQGEKIDPDEMARIKKEIGGAAYEYASYMLIARKDSIEWLKENEGKL